MSHEKQKNDIATSIEAVADSYDEATRAQIEQLEELAYDNHLPAGERLEHLSQIMKLKEQAADAYALEVIGQPESMFPTREEVSRHIGHKARKVWQILNTPVTQLPHIKLADLAS